MVFTYTVTQRSGRQHDVLLDDDSPAIGKTISYSNSHGYFVVRHENKLMLLHRFLMPHATADEIVDHKDQNRCNQQLHNLRIANKRTNGWNMAKRRSNTTGSIGVYRKKIGAPFFAKIKDANGKQVQLGSFHTVKEAEICYDMACHNIRGEFAVLNNADNVFKNRLSII